MIAAYRMGVSLGWERGPDAATAELQASGASDGLWQPTGVAALLLRPWAPRLAPDISPHCYKHAGGLETASNITQGCCRAPLAGGGPSQ